MHTGANPDNLGPSLEAGHPKTRPAPTRKRERPDPGRSRLLIFLALTWLLATALPSQDLLQPTDLEYRGAFRLPHGAQPGGSSFTFGGMAGCLGPAGNTLYLRGHPYQELVAEVTIPAPVVSATKRWQDLPTAALTYLHRMLFTDPAELKDVAGGTKRYNEVRHYAEASTDGWMWPNCAGFVGGTTWDAKGRRLFVAQGGGTVSWRPTVHVFKVGVAPPPPTPPPPPPPHDNALAERELELEGILREIRGLADKALEPNG